MGDAERFVGVWELEAILETSEETGGKSVFEGNRAGRPAVGFEKPVGLLIYLASGEMSVHFSGSARSPFPREFSPTPSELAAAGAAYGGYAGRWEVDEARREVLHHVEVGFVPNRVGRTVRRSYSFEESPGSLVLSLRPLPLSSREEVSGRVLRWRRRATP